MLGGGISNQTQRVRLLHLGTPFRLLGRYKSITQSVCTCAAGRSYLTGTTVSRTSSAAFTLAVSLHGRLWSSKSPPPGMPPALYSCST